MTAPLKLTPTMPQQVMVDAINQNFRQIEAESRRKVVTDEDGKDRILIGKKEDGKYAIKVSAPGYDVNTATDEQLVMSSDWNMWKIIHEGIVNVTPRSTPITLSGNNIGYLMDIAVYVLPTSGMTLPTAKYMTNVCYLGGLSDIIKSGTFYDDGTNKVIYEYRYESVFNSRTLRITFALRLISGSFTFNPSNAFGGSLYWQIANNTQGQKYGMGAVIPGEGKYFYLDNIAYNADGTVAIALASDLVEFHSDTGDTWKYFPYQLPPCYVAD